MLLERRKRTLVSIDVMAKRVNEKKEIRKKGEKYNNLGTVKMKDLPEFFFENLGAMTLNLGSSMNFLTENMKF